MPLHKYAAIRRSVVARRVAVTTIVSGVTVSSSLPASCAKAGVASVAPEMIVADSRPNLIRALFLMVFLPVSIG